MSWNRPSIVWIGPLPPARTDIAEYTRRLAPYLDAAFDVRYLYEPMKDTPEMPAKSTCLPLSEETLQRMLDERRLIVWHVGNNALFHGQILALSRSLPGLLVVHDMRLQDLVTARLRRERDWPENYLASMRAAYGSEGEQAARRVVEGRATPHGISEDYPLIEPVAGRALGLITHNKALMEPLRRRTARPVACLDLPFPPASFPPAERLVSDTIRLVQFGFMGANRCLSAILQALSAVRDLARFRLDIFGVLDDSEGAADAIETLGLRDVVQVHGYVAESVLDAALDVADLVFNLRWPSMGEASGSQLRIFSRGAAAVVVDTDWYSALPEGTVIKLPPHDMVGALRRLLGELAGGRDLRGEIGEAGRRHLMAVHHPHTYVEHLRAVIDVLPDWCPSWSTLRVGSGVIDDWSRLGVSFPQAPRLVVSHMESLTSI